MTDTSTRAQSNRREVVYQAIDIVKHSELRKNTIQEYADEVITVAGKLETFIAGSAEAGDK